MCALDGTKDLANVIAETDVEHAIDFIEARELQLLVGEQSTLVEVHHASRSSNDDLRALLELRDLFADLLPAIDRNRLHIRKATEFLKFLRNLHREFARGHKDERGDWARWIEGVQKGKSECSGLASACLRLTEDIASCDRCGDQRRLNLGWMLEASGGDAFEERLLQSEVSECLVDRKDLSVAACPNNLSLCGSRLRNGRLCRLCGRIHRTAMVRQRAARYKYECKRSRKYAWSAVPLFSRVFAPSRASLRLLAGFMQDTSLLEFDTSAITHNLRVLRGVVGVDCARCPIVQADAYGLGSLHLAPVLAQGADMLAVYSPKQAEEILRAGVCNIAIVVLMPVRVIEESDELTRHAKRGLLHFVVHDAAQCAALELAADSLGVQLGVHLELDTGMSRGGARREVAAALLHTLASTPSLRLKGLFTHFANSRTSETLTRAQLDAFREFIAQQSASIGADCLLHVASSYALMRHRDYHFNMVRFGLAWLGYGTEELEASEPLVKPGELRPVVRWSTSIVQTKRIPEGASVGYGSLFTATRDSTIALLPVGYADGYPVPRGSSSQGRQSVAICLSGKRRAFVPVVGAVNMDQLTIDITELEPFGVRDWTGTEVELITPSWEAPNHLPKLAASAGLIPHELLTRLHARIPRKRVQTSRSSLVEPTVHVVPLALRSANA